MMTAEIRDRPPSGQQVGSRERVNGQWLAANECWQLTARRFIGSTAPAGASFSCPP